MEPHRLITSDYFEEGLPPVFVMNAEHHDKVSLHSHEFYELVFIERGVALHSHENSTQILTTGDFFVILPGEVHSYISTNNAALYNCLFTGEALAGLEAHAAGLDGLRRFSGGRAFERLHAGLAEMQEIQVTLERMIWERLNRPVGWELKTKSLFENLLVTYARLYGSNARLEGGAGANFNSIMKAVGYIESNFTRDMPLEEVAKASGLSTGYLSRQFKGVLGTSPSEYARNFRIAKAAELLREEGRTVADVSAALGFADLSLFSRQFKQVTGISPTGFRKNK
jgi:AraC-like DNA-binding protein